MFERFTDRARRVVVLSQEEARLLGHNYIGTEHLLLGVVREGEGAASHVLVALGVDLAAVSEKVMAVLSGTEVGHRLAPTPYARRMALAAEMRAQGLAVAGRRERAAARALAAAGVELGPRVTSLAPSASGTSRSTPKSCSRAS